MVLMHSRNISLLTLNEKCWWITIPASRWQCEHASARWLRGQKGIAICWAEVRHYICWGKKQPKQRNMPSKYVPAGGGRFIMQVLHYGLNIQRMEFVWMKTLRPRQNGSHFPDNIFKCIFLNGNVKILIKISLKFVPRSPNNNIPSLVQIMAWRLPGDKPLSEPMMVSLQTHLCVTRP